MNLTTIERAMQRLESEVQVEPEKLEKMTTADKDLLFSSMSEEWKWKSLKKNFLTLPDGTVGWKDSK